MKKPLLLLASVLTTILSYGQVITYVQQPASLQGALQATYATWTNLPNLTVPANAVEAAAIFALDASAADSLACGVLANAAAVSGKIAVVYRGDCEFSMKALRAQNAGARAVIVINNEDGPPVAMGAGSNSNSVHIPVVMIRKDAGATLRSELEAGNVVIRIGTVQNMFAYNLSIDAGAVLMPAQSGIPKWLAAQPGDLTVQPGAWVTNFGAQAQSGVTLSGKVEHNGSAVYEQTSQAQAIASGDSVFFTLPPFTQNSYNGIYDFTYTVQSANIDGEPSDNTFGFNMQADTIFSYGPIDPATRLTKPSYYIQPADNTNGFGNCVAFRNPHANRVKVEGLYVSASNDEGTMDGEMLEAHLIEWGDAFDDFNETPTFTAMNTFATGEYYYQSDLTDELVYIPFTEPFPLENNTRYLFCAYTNNPNVFMGYSQETDYSTTTDEVLQPSSVLDVNGHWYAVGFGLSKVSCLAVRMTQNDVGMQDHDRVDVVPFPNPASAQIRIPLAGQSGAATLQVFSLDGAKVAERRVALAGDSSLTMDVTDMANGTYLFKMDFDNGKHASFRVVVTK